MRRFGLRGLERGTFDRRLVDVAGQLVSRPDRIPDVAVTTAAEMELAAVARDQQDLVFGMMVLLLRLLAAGTAGGSADPAHRGFHRVGDPQRATATG